jgi:DNA-binding GntR family transcriptional regulator
MTNLVDQAYLAIRTKIFDNTYAPGFSALESSLAEELGVSRTPLREALIRLKQEGLVEVIPRHGMRVLPMSARDMAEIYQILSALESSAAEMLAARKPSAKELEPLKAATKQMTDALKKDDLKAWALADERFHLHLIELAGNRLLAQAVSAYWDRAHRARMFTLKLRPKPVNSTKEHAQIVDCIARGDSKAAGDLFRAHRQRASSELTTILNHYGFQQV